MMDQTLIAVLAFTKPVLTFLGQAAWPISAVYIANRFKEPITEVILKVKKFSAFGTTVEMPPSSQQDAISDDSAHLLSPGALSVSPEPPSSPLLQPIEADLTRAFNEEALSLDQKFKWALRIASSNAMAIRHGEHYRLIFGSQIAFLKTVNVASMVSLNDARRFFDQYAAKPAPYANYNFDNWLLFMTTPGNDLDLVSGPGGEEELHLSLVGKNFLLWMANQGASEAKPF